MDEFFDRYAAALLARDEKAVATMYAVPGLILFPGVHGADRTAPDRELRVLAEAPGSVWADVTWTYGGEPRERFCYQLVERPDGWQIAVLTPMAL